MLEGKAGSRALSAVFLLSVFASAAHAQVRYGDIAVTALENSFQGFHGYVEYRIQVSNLSAETAHRVRLFLPREPQTFNPGWASIEEISRTITVPAASTLSVSLAQPGLAMFGDNHLGVSIDGQEQQEGVPMPLKHSPMSPAYAVLAYAVTISRDADLFEVQFKRAQDAAKASAGSGASGVPARAISSTVVNRIPLQRSQWSPNWLAYSGQDAVVVTAWDLQAAPVEARSALFEYMESGGLLVVLGSFAIPAHWQKTADILGGSETYAVSFGRCLLVPQGAYDDWDQAQWAAFFAALEGTAGPWRTWNAFAANKEFPVTEELEIPIRGLFLLMILFVFTIGPLNIFLVSRINKRIWLWWTVPAISLATTAAVAGYTVFSEGFRSHLRSETLTVLDESRHQASTIGLTAFYSTLAPSGGLHFDRRTEVAPLYSSLTTGGGWRSIDWTERQQLATGWIRARIPAHFAIRKPEGRRERLPLRQAADGSLSALNGLGAPIRKLWYVSPQGTLYQQEGFAAGEEKKLIALRSFMPPTPRRYLLRRFYSRDDPIAKLLSDPEQYLSAGTYIAELEGSPFLESGLPSPKTRDLKSIVFGISREAPRP